MWEEPEEVCFEITSVQKLHFVKWDFPVMVAHK